MVSRANRFWPCGLFWTFKRFRFGPRGPGILDRGENGCHDLGSLVTASDLKTNMSMEKPPFEDVPPIKTGDFSWPC